MSIDYQHVRPQLQKIVHDYRDAEGYERGQSQNFWTQVFNAYGVSGQTQLKAFEHRLKDGSGQKYVDAFIPNLVIIEQKSRGVDLNKAYQQVSGYFDRLNAAERPRYIILCNFDELWLYDVANPLSIKTHQFALMDLPKQAERLAFLDPDTQTTEIIEENPINRQATEMVAKLHQAFMDDGVNANDLALFLTRLIFCFFADDTGIFGQKHLLQELLKRHAQPDGSNLHQVLGTLFETLNNPKRSSRLPADYARFAYVNGDLFAANVPIPYFDAHLYALVMACNGLDWSEISPAIFGSMFQRVLDVGISIDPSSKDTRREFGAHYTSEKNILRVVNSLFLNDLRDEFSKCTKDRPRAIRLYDRLSTLKFFDPACGCGNFLIIAYRELRLLENQLIALIYGDRQRGLLDIATMSRVTVEQFYGIEIEPHAAHIARVAMWITDHQLNLATAERFGQTRATTPIVYSPHIAEGNALRLDWSAVLPPNECSYVMGNPPFIGKAYQSEQQKADMDRVARAIKGHKILDYVAAWYIKAMHYMQAVTQNNHRIETAFVSTNSIVQGEQVAILWKYLLSDCKGFINFAHQTFKWSNEGKGVAAVHCVIVGYGLQERDEKIVFSYDDIGAEPQPHKVKNINGYLVGGDPVFFDNTRDQVSGEKPIHFGSMPNDGGHLLLTDHEYVELMEKEPLSKKYLRTFMGSQEFLNDIKRWCLWFHDHDALALNQDLSKMPLVCERLEKVKKTRQQSKNVDAQDCAATPHLFFSERQPRSGRYLIIPKVSSENRKFIPIGYVDSNIIGSDLVFNMPEADLYHFGVLSSSMHNAFMRLVAGRLKSDYRYSKGIVYNNFPYPFMADDTSKKAKDARLAIGQAAQGVLDARERYRQAVPKPTLAQLYNRYLIDPYPDLTQAHAALDRAVDRAYGYKGNGSDESRVEFLLKALILLTSNGESQAQPIF